MAHYLITGISNGILIGIGLVSAVVGGMMIYAGILAVIEMFRG